MPEPSASERQNLLGSLALAWSSSSLTLAFLPVRALPSAGCGSMLERAFGDSLIVPCPSGPQPQRPNDRAAVSAAAAEILADFAWKIATKRTPVTSHMDEGENETRPVCCINMHPARQDPIAPIMSVPIQSRETR